MKTLCLGLCLFVFSVIAGCSSAPIATAPMFTPTQAVEIKNLQYKFTDARHDDYKTSPGCFRISTEHVRIANTCADAAYDKPLNKVFNEMFLARFPTSADGYLTEIKLTAFNSYWSPHSSEYIAGSFGLLGALAVNSADPSTDYYGICKVDILIVDKTNKTIFNKTYNAEIHEAASRKEINRNGLIVLQKAFQKVAGDFENDVKAIKFE